MAIRIKYDAAAVVPPSNETTRKYGQNLVQQQRQQNFLGQQQGYDRMAALGREQMQQQGLEMGRQQDFINAARKQSTGMIMDDIENGMYDPVTANKLRQNLVEEAEALSNPHLDPTQRAVVLEKYRAARALHTANRMEKPYRPDLGEQFKQDVYTDNAGDQWQKTTRGWERIESKQKPPTSFGEWAQQPENLAKAQSQLAAKQAEIQRRMELEEGYPPLKEGETIQDRALDELETQFGAIQKRYGPPAAGSGAGAQPTRMPVGSSPGAVYGGAGQSPINRDLALGPGHPDYQQPKPDDIVGELEVWRADGRPTLQRRDGKTVLGEPRDVDAAQPELLQQGTGGGLFRVVDDPQTRVNASLGGGQQVPQNDWAEMLTGGDPQAQAIDALRQRNNPAALRRDVQSGNYANTPEDQAQLDAAAQQRYLQEQGPSMGRYTGVLNQQADAMSENLAGSEGRIASQVPYGARNVYSPLGGEGELQYQQGLKSGVPSQEELMAQNKAQVDSMRGTQATNNAAMQERDTNKINNPKQMRIDMQATTDAYNIYKRKGGTMMFRQWANVAKEQGIINNPDVQRQLQQNYPGIWDQRKIDPASTDIDSVAPNSGNTARGKVAKRRAGLLALNGMPQDAPTPQAAVPNQAVPPSGAPNQGVPPSPPMQGTPTPPVPMQEQPEAEPYVSPTLRKDFGKSSPKYDRFGAAPPPSAYPQRPPVPTPSGIQPQSPVAPMPAAPVAPAAAPIQGGTTEFQGLQARATELDQKIQAASTSRLASNNPDVLVNLRKQRAQVNAELQKLAKAGKRPQDFAEAEFQLKNLRSQYPDMASMPAEAKKQLKQAIAVIQAGR